MLGYNRTINVLINIGPGVWGGRKRRGKNGNLPNTFDDDCRCQSMCISDAFIWHIQRKARRIHCIIQVSWSAWWQYSYRIALYLNCRIQVVEATLENKCTVSACVFNTTITQVMLSVLTLFILFPVVFHVALVYT